MRGNEETIIRLVHQQLADPETGFAVGCYGAVAEFMRHADEAVRIAEAQASVEIASARGALRIAGAAGARVIAYQSLSPDPMAWRHGIAICLPDQVARGQGRRVITELGPDADAVRPEDKAAILFDLGVGAPHIEFCVRTSERALLAVLREAAGSSIFAPDGRAMHAIFAASPHRICRSALGRIEVYVPIPFGPNAATPDGPHTHLLPKFLALGRSHAPLSPVPAGWLACLDIYPPSPVLDERGQRQAFDAGRQRVFGQILERFGLPEFVAAKERLRAAVLAGRTPAQNFVNGSPLARRAVRIALRELRHTHRDAPTLPAWIAAFDPAGAEDRETADGH